MTHSEKLTLLMKLSHDLGREDRGLAILGEGNTSVQLNEETFMVKASGTSLGNITEHQFVTCKFAALMPLLESGEMSDADVERELLASRIDPKSPKPSVEALFHAYLLSLPKIEVVGHTHPIAVNQLLSAGAMNGARDLPMNGVFRTKSFAVAPGPSWFLTPILASRWPA